MVLGSDRLRLSEYRFNIDMIRRPRQQGIGGGGKQEEGSMDGILKTPTFSKAQRLKS